jgi:two-component system, NarL family, response regulator LiaR
MSVFEVAMKKISLVIIEDHKILRELLVHALGNEDHIEVTGDWADAESALNALKNTAPDIAIVDNILPGMNGIAFTEKALALKPDMKILFLSMCIDKQTIVRAFKAGAVAYLPKDVTTKELLDALSAIDAGETFLSPRITRKILDMLMSPPDEKNTDEILTEEQIKMLKLASKGLSNKEIAGVIGVPVTTIKSRFFDVCKRLNTRDRTHTVTEAIKLGLFVPDDRNADDDRISAERNF